MSSITTIKMLRTVDIKLIPNRFFALCIGIIMMVCANTCIAQETEQFKLVKNVTELQEGDIVIVVNNTNEHCSALSTKWGSRKIEGYKININGETITKLKRSYPNYFLDAQNFIKNIQVKLK